MIIGNLFARVSKGLEITWFNAYIDLLLEDLSPLGNRGSKYEKSLQKWFVYWNYVN